MNQTPKGEARTEPAPGSVVLVAHPDGSFVRPVLYPATASQPPVWPDEKLMVALHYEVLDLRAALAQSRTPEPAPDIDQAWKEGFCRGHEMASTVRDVTEALNAARKKFGLDHPAGAVAEAAQPEPAPMSKIEAAGRQAMRAMNERHRAEGREAPQRWEPAEPTAEMLDAGQHVLSEHLDDDAPLRERTYREPARAAWLAMQAQARGEAVAFGPPAVRGRLGRNLK